MTHPAFRNPAFRDDKARRRFELEEAGSVAFADYRRHEGPGGVWVDIRHVETPEAMQGRGAATRLMDAIVDWAKAEGVRLRPTCPFAVAYFAKRPEIQALRA